MTEDSLRQSILDEDHLKLLSIGYMVSAAMSAFTSLIGLFYMFFGVMVGSMIAHAPHTTTGKGQEPPPEFFGSIFGWLFGGIGLVFFVLAIALAAVQLRTAFCLQERKSRIFCMVVAGISCLGVPYGTLLGVFTFIVLGRPSVMQTFDRSLASPPAA